MDTILEKYNLGRSTRQIRFSPVIGHHPLCIHPLLASGERDVKSNGGVPSFIWKTRGAVDSPKCPASRAEEGRPRCSLRENKEQPLAGWGAISFMWRKEGGDLVNMPCIFVYDAEAVVAFLSY
ncbi:hypothetical protein CDAR_198721 [Caerostris darwini]|uniref:Uncharacterized protein n=1 Tax=Caerostris darwini TaxID=1538125 RepID=A0AAV4W390_9ARAC|nr:hypothetical protein CDAR_198721 [Caerostris darwini]